MTVTVLGPQGYSRPPYGSFAGKPVPVPVAVIAGTIYYIFEFADLAAAQSDTVVSAFPFKEVLVFRDLTQNSVVANAGFWCRVIQINQTSLVGHPNLQVAFDIHRTVLTTKVPIDHIGIVINAYDNFIDGLLPSPYITEDSSAFYITEDGNTFYVQETT